MSQVEAIVEAPPEATTAQVVAVSLNLISFPESLSFLAQPDEPSFGDQPLLAGHCWPVNRSKCGNPCGA